MRNKKMRITFAVLAVLLCICLIPVMQRKNDSKKNDGNHNLGIQKDIAQSTEDSKVVSGDKNEETEGQGQGGNGSATDKSHLQGSSSKQDVDSNQDGSIDFNEIVSDRKENPGNNNTDTEIIGNTLDSNILKDDPKEKWSMPK